ncbi:Glyoxalase family protein [Planococcus halocryophilus Or1]|uniref:Glyoxalase n=1 Tax=Planococcus halocryophilus TaxID=1215089 RepID=A0A1C7DUL5_9BACL|nr:VOC family protein [Planococcus halocryophilus]ANU14998.1 glyoxalase [Planococcus halocryophilus]EMF45673.1 Glyoxalase family protein [Planococcus halocryophilus Or1]
MNFHKKPVTHVGEVGLKVVNLLKMKKFYENVIGFEVISEEEDKVSLGVGSEVLVELEVVEGLTQKQGRYAGLYHFAILLPSRESLGKMLVHLHQQGIQLGSADHLVSEALYLSDPEGNGIEIYQDRKPELWNWSNDEVSMAVDPIDAQGLVDEAQKSSEPWNGLPAETVIGHIHLHMSNLDEAKDFYVNGLGLAVVSSLGGQAIFLADQKYHHHIGMNVWNGVGIPALPEKEAGLHYYTLVMENENRNKIAKNLRSIGTEIVHRDDYWEVKDPSGNSVRLCV